MILYYEATLHILRRSVMFDFEKYHIVYSFSFDNCNLLHHKLDLDDNSTAQIH